MEIDDYHFKLKIVIIGDKGVGKTTFLDAITSNFGKIVESEQSNELNTRVVGYLDDNTLFQIHYWEILGSLKSSGYFYRYCLGASAAIYMFDASKRSSFEKVEKWITENEKCDVPVKVLVGNKIDLMNNSKTSISKSEAISLARKYGMEYFEACALGETSVAPVYDYVFSTIVNSIPNPPTPSQLMGKGIILGKRLINSTKYQLALCDIASLYE